MGLTSHDYSRALSPVTLAPKPKGRSWTEAENTILRAYAAGEISHTELFGRLPGRTWDGIGTQLRLLGLAMRRPQVYYRVLRDTREMLSADDHSKMGSHRYNLTDIVELAAIVALAERVQMHDGIRLARVGYRDRNYGHPTTEPKIKFSPRPECPHLPYLPLMTVFTPRNT